LEIVGPGVAADCREQQDGLHVQEACRCGRTLARMSPVRGRRDDMLIIRGVNLYPSEVERVLLGIEGHRPALPTPARAAPGAGRAQGPL
jgi:phenylacetate-coenzyme A ligase PaaK-like adenylate-forming protein